MTKTTREIYRDKALRARQESPGAQVGVHCQDLLALLEDAEEYERLSARPPHLMSVRQQALERVARLLIESGVDIVQLTTGVLGGEPPDSCQVFRPRNMGSDVFGQLLGEAVRRLGDRQARLLEAQPDPRR